ncbi:T9SS type A sorting domain-containing protein [Cognatitamlana onchidii]|uniref:hypothetical protein n=1 Tax=Cognatitamlana onchidii TaxID=2562860 RepID=UPI0010A5B26E|nr:hypothetical protein [Algibacter onchidii]
MARYCPAGLNYDYPISALDFYPDPAKNTVQSNIDSSNASTIDISVYNIQGIGVFQNKNLQITTGNKFILN